MALGPPPHGLPDWNAERCAGCHEQADAWAHGGHAQSRGWVFEAGVKRDDPAWCVRCHAPQAATALSRRKPILT